MSNHLGTLTPGGVAHYSPIFDAAKYSVWLTDPRAVAFICIGCGMMFLIGVYYFVSLFLKKFRVQNRIATKIFQTKYAIWLAVGLSIIVGLIYDSLKGYQNLLFDHPHAVAGPNVSLTPGDFEGTSAPGANQLWVWQAVSFNYAVGTWVVTSLFFSIWLMIPAASYISMRKIFQEEIRKGWFFGFKKWLWINFMAIVTLGVMCLFYVVPLNAEDTSLKIFGIGANTNFNYYNTATHTIYSIDDKFYYAAKWVYDHIFYTKWYMILFILWLFANVVVFGAIAYVEIVRDHPIIAKTLVARVCLKDLGHGKVLHKFGTGEYVIRTMMFPYKLFDCFASIELYAFFTAFMLFNIRSLFVHIAMIILLIIIAYAIIMVAIFFYGLMRFPKNSKGYVTAYFEIIYKKYFTLFVRRVDKDKPLLSDPVMMTKYDDTNFNSLKITHSVVIGVAFTIFLGFTNLTDFHGQWNAVFYQLGHTHHNWGVIMYSPWFWFSVGLSAVLINYLIIDSENQSSMAKNAVGSAGYGVAPGMQTGTLAFLGAWLGRSSGMIDEQIRLVI